MAAQPAELQSKNNATMANDKVGQIPLDDKHTDEMERQATKQQDEPIPQNPKHTDVKIGRDHLNVLAKNILDSLQKYDEGIKPDPKLLKTLLTSYTKLISEIKKSKVSSSPALSDIMTNIENCFYSIVQMNSVNNANQKSSLPSSALNLRGSSSSSGPSSPHVGSSSSSNVPGVTEASHQNFATRTGGKHVIGAIDEKIGNKKGRKVSRPPLPQVPIHLIQEQQHYEFNVPDDGNCLFYSITFSALLPLLNDEAEFHDLYLKLFGKKNASSENEIKALLHKYDGTPEFITTDAPTLGVMIATSFRENLVDFIKTLEKEFSEIKYTESGDFQGEMARMRIPGTFGSFREIEAASQFLKRKIVAYQEHEGVLKERYVSVGNFLDSLHIVFAHSQEGNRHNHYHFCLLSKYLPNDPSLLSGQECQEDNDHTKLPVAVSSGLNASSSPSSTNSSSSSSSPSSTSSSGGPSSNSASSSSDSSLSHGSSSSSTSLIHSFCPVYLDPPRPYPNKGIIFLENMNGSASSTTRSYEVILPKGEKYQNLQISIENLDRIKRGLLQDKEVNIEQDRNTLNQLLQSIEHINTSLSSHTSNTNAGNGTQSVMHEIPALLQKFFSIKEAQEAELLKRLQEIVNKHVSLGLNMINSDINLIRSALENLPSGKHVEKIKKILSPLNLSANSSSGPVKQNDAALINSAKKTEADLKNLSEIKKIIEQIIKGKFDASCLDKIERIGQLLYEISWDEENTNCIRNKHGYRNRHKDAANHINKSGAKIDFESLSHLKDLVHDPKLNQILLSDFTLVKASLEILKSKIELVEANAQNLQAINREKKEVQGIVAEQDIGFLKIISSYYYDLICIDRMLSMLHHFDFNNLNLSNMVDRYQLGYFFIQFGEIAKEISDFIKYEIHEKDEDNYTRFMFGKIGKYRQKIKDSPIRVQGDNILPLMLMRDSLNNIKDDLIHILDLLKKEILSLTEKNKENIAHAINTQYPVFNQPSPKSKLSKLEKSISTQIQKVIPSLHEGVCNLKKRTKSLSEQVAKCKEELETIKNKEKELENNLNKMSEGKHEITKQSSNSEIQKTFLTCVSQTNIAKQLSALIKCCQLDKLPGLGFSPQQVFIISFFHTENKGPVHDGKKIVPLKSIIAKYEESLLKNIKIFNNGKENKDQIKDIEHLLKLMSHTEEDKSLAMKRELQVIKSKLTEKNRMLKELTEELHKTKEQYSKYLKLSQSSKAPIVNYNSLSPETDIKDIDEHQKIILALIKEIQFLKYLYNELSQALFVGNAERYEKFLMASKMSFGFIGQYNKKIISYRAKLETNLVKSSILGSDMITVMLLRHKKICHNTYLCDPKELLKIIPTKIIPWLNDFKSIAFLLLDQKNVAHQEWFDLAPEDDRIDKRYQELFLKIPGIFLKYKRLVSLNRLLKNKDALKEYNEILKMIDENTDPLLLTEIHWQGSLTHRNEGNWSNCVVLLDLALKYAQKMSPQYIRYFKVHGIHADLGIAYIELDQYNVAEQWLQKVNLSEHASVAQIISANCLLSGVFLLQGFPLLGIRSLELNFVKNFDNIMKLNKLISFNLTITLASAYLDYFDIKKAKDCLNFAEHLLKTNFHGYVAQSGQFSIYYQLIFRYTLARYKLIQGLTLAQNESEKALLELSNQLSLDKLHRESIQYFSEKEKNLIAPLISLIILGFGEGEIANSFLQAFYADSIYSDNCEKIFNKNVKDILFKIKSKIAEYSQNHGKNLPVTRAAYLCLKKIDNLTHELIKNLYLLAYRKFLLKQFKEASNEIKKAIFCVELLDFLFEELELVGHKKQLEWLNKDINLPKLKEHVCKKLSASKHKWSLPGSSIIEKYEKNKNDPERLKELITKQEELLLEAFYLEKDLLLEQHKIDPVSLDRIYRAPLFKKGKLSIQTTITKLSEIIIKKYDLKDLSPKNLERGLKIASEQDQYKDIEVFIKLGANVNAEDELNRTAFYYAVSHENLASARELLRNGALFEAKDFEGKIIKNKELRVLIELLKKYLTRNFTKNYLERALRMAACNKQPLDIQGFINLGVNVNAQDERVKKTALHYAMFKESPECYEILLENGARLDIKDNEGKTPIDFLKEQHEIFRISQAYVISNPNILQDALVDNLQDNKAKENDRDQRPQLLHNFTGSMKNQVGSTFNSEIFPSAPPMSSNTAMLPASSVASSSSDVVFHPSSLSNGDCAINVVVLGICQLAEANRLTEPNLYKTLTQEINKAPDVKVVAESRDGFLCWLALVKDSAERQRQLSPILRKLAVNEILQNYQSYKETYQQSLISAFGLFREGIGEESFVVHKHIKEKFEELRITLSNDPKHIKEIERQLIDWWDHEGKKTYFDNLSLPARGAGDLERWGSEVEIGILACKLGVTVRSHKGSGVQLLGVGHGIISNLTPHELAQLDTLKLGSRCAVGFMLTINNRETLVRILDIPSKFSGLEREALKNENLEATKSAILSFINDNILKVIPGISDIKLFYDKLSYAGILVSKTNGKGMRFFNDESIPLYIIEIPGLKQKVLNAYRIDVPCFNIRHEGGHWYYKGVILNEVSQEQKGQQDRIETRLPVAVSAVVHDASVSVPDISIPVHTNSSSFFIPQFSQKLQNRKKEIIEALQKNEVLRPILLNIKKYAIENNVDQLKELVPRFRANGGNINEYCGTWGTVLHHAVKAQSIDAAVYLVVEGGANVNIDTHPSVPRKGNTPLRILTTNQKLLEYETKKKDYEKKLNVKITNK